jgi:hypothetical protein
MAVEPDDLYVDRELDLYFFDCLNKSIEEITRATPEEVENFNYSNCSFSKVNEERGIWGVKSPGEIGESFPFKNSR